ncbi:hypothetical protein FRC20_001213, partial [Serendipita sp. 405]
MCRAVCAGEALCGCGWRPPGGCDSLMDYVKRTRSPPYENPCWEERRDFRGDKIFLNGDETGVKGTLRRPGRVGLAGPFSNKAGEFLVTKTCDLLRWIFCVGWLTRLEKLS